MSFFKKLTKEFEELGFGSDDRKDEGHPGQRGYPPSQPYGGGMGQPYQYPTSASPYQGQYQPQSPPTAPPPGYGAPPPPPIYSPPPDKPPIPAGWIPQFDRQYQRWYYFEHATGRSQWEVPGYYPPRPPMPGTGQGYDSRGQHNSSHSYHGYGGHGGQEHGEKKGHGGMLLGAAGGLAVGAIGGALLANALDDSGDEHHHAAAPVYAAPAEPAALPPVLQTHDAYGEEVDSSDRESVQEAREEYEEALAAAADSDASSSEQEELEEAREEYEEEYEEAYYDD